MIQPKRNHRKIWSKIHPNWDYDLHIHTNWSQDNLEGPQMEDWIEYGKKYKIHLGFADHFEMWYYFSNDQKYGKWRLNPDTIDDYIEEVNSIKKRHKNVTSGLEIDDSPKYHTQIEEFCEKYGNEFDFLIGSIHRLDTSDEIPVKSDLLKILTHFDNWEHFLDKYFEYQQIMVETNLFDGIAHPKVIFRDFTAQEIPNRIFLYAQEKLKILAKSCSDRGILIEANLSGFRKPWKESFPSSKMIKHLIAENFPLYIGSDSHTPAQFESLIIEIRKYNHILRNQWLFEKKFDC